MATKDEHPIGRTAWMRAEQVALSPRGRYRLAPGIWIVTQTIAWPASALDIAAHLPWVEPEVEPISRGHLIPRWHDQAACNEVPNADDLFFGLDDEGHPPLPPRYFRAARAICEQCPVIRKCLTQALGQPEHFGVWAGTTGRQRVPLRARIKAGESVESLVDEWLAKE